MHAVQERAPVAEATHPEEMDSNQDSAPIQQAPVYNDSSQFATKGDLDRLEARINRRIDRGFERIDRDFERVDRGFERIEKMLQRRSDFRRSVVIALISAVVGAAVGAAVTAILV